MKKIYLLLLLCLLSIRGFSTKYYSTLSGDMTQDSVWCVSESALLCSFNPILPGAIGDTWVVQTALFIPPGGKFYVKGSLEILYSVSTILRMGTQPDTMQINQNLIFTAGGGSGFMTSVAGAGPLTMNVGGNFYMDGSTFISDSTSSSTTINIGGNMDMEGSAYINSDSGKIAVFFNGQDLVYGAPQTLTWNSTGVSKYLRFEIDAPDTVALLSYVPLPDSPAAPGEVLNGELICNTFGMYGNGDGTQPFYINTGATVATANTGGIDSSVKYCVNSFSMYTNYIFNGLSPQVTGVTMPDSLAYDGYSYSANVTINNPTGVTLSKSLKFTLSGGTLNLENGLFTIGMVDSILTMDYGNVAVDTGTFSSGPTYIDQVMVDYTNLGYNALAVTTGYELLPVTSTSITEIYLKTSKPGATITLGSSPSVDVDVVLEAGTLDASANNYNLTVNAFWSNNVGPTAFVPRAATVNFTGDGYIPPTTTTWNYFIGPGSTAFNNVTVNNHQGLTLVALSGPGPLSADEIINGTLTLDTGNVYIYNRNLIFGPSATAVAGSPSAMNMIVADSTGEVRKQMNADGTFLYPVGDSLNYSPITLAYAGSGAYNPGAFAGITVHNQKDPHNTDTDNYINRYWTVTDSAITAPSYSVTAVYVPGDVVGTQADIAMGEYNGALPWIQYGLTNVDTLTASPVTDSVADFTGIDATFPTVTVSDDTSLCLGGMDTLRVLSATGDTPFAYTWAPAASLSASTGTAVAATPTVTTTYTCTVTDANGITNTDTVTVTVNPVPTIVNATNNGPICADSTLTLIANGPLNVTGYLWQGPAVITDSAGDTATVPGAAPSATGIYTVTVNDGVGSGCTAVYYDTAVVDTLPDSTVVTGGGVYCDSNTIFAFNPGAGTIYFEDTVSNGTNTDIPATSMLITNVGTYTYYFRAQSIFGCWGAQDSATVTINPLPLPDTAYGGGTFCDSTVISSSNGDSGTIYFQGAVSNGTSTTMGGTPQTVTTLGAITYYFRAQSAAGCWGQQDSVTVTLNPTPAPVTASGSGTFCGIDTISATGGAGGTIYYQFDTSLGMDSVLGGTPEVVDSSGTYFFRSEAAGCWSKQDSVIVVINPLPATIIISTNGGGTTFCDSTTIFATGGDGIVYFEDTTTNGTSTATPAISAFIDTSGTYHFRAQNPVTGCWSNDTSVSITINPFPSPDTALGSGGPFCGSTVITGSDGSTDPSIIVYFEGTAPGGTSTAYGFPDSLSYTVTTSGTYYFRAQNSYGCWSQEGLSDDSATVLINPLPPMHNVTGGGSYCAGGAGFHIGLDGSDTGIKYQLYNGSDTLVPVLTGTGSPLDFGVYTDSDVYYVIAINNTTGCNDTTATSVLINVNPLPNVYNMDTTYPGNGGPYCFGGIGSDIQLLGSDFNVNYLVYDDGILDTTEYSYGGAIDLGNFTDTGTYTVIAMTDSGCTANMLDSAVITTYPLPTIYTVSGGGVMCAGDTGFHVFLSGSQSGLQYQLYNTGAAGSLPMLTGAGHPLDFGLQTAPGFYTVVATVVNPLATCTNNMAGSATITVNPLPDGETISGGGGYCSGTGGVPISVGGSDSGDSYQLYYNGVPDGSAIIATGAPFNFPLQIPAGTYAVVAANPVTGCISDTLGDAIVSIYPLPAIYTLFGGGSYCAGGVGFNIGLSGTQVGVVYELFNGSTLDTTIDGAGALDSFGHQTAAGTYTVIAVNPVTSCVSNILGSVTIAINALPLVDSVTGGGSYCSGSPGVHIGLTGSTIGIDYQLSTGGSSVGGPVAGTNSPLAFGVFLPAGTYKVSAINVVTGCISNMADSAIININPLPTVYDITGGGSYCAGDSGVYIGLNGSDSGVNYQLYHGTVALGDSLPGRDTALDYGLFTAPGGYSVIAVNTTTRCTDSMAGIETISINPLPPAHLVLGGGIYCVGGAGVDVELSSSDDGYIYLLYDSTVTVGPPLAGTGSLLNFGLLTLGGTYTVYAIDTTTTCADSMTGSAIVTVDVPFIPIVSLVAHPGTDVGVGARDTLVASVTDGGPDATYQWYVNGNLVPGATDDTFAFNIYYNTDSITCQVTSHGVCGDYTASQSVFITLHNVGVSQLTNTGNDIKLMPNPNKGAFTIKGTLGTTADEEVSVEVTDMLGQTVYKDKIMATGGNIDQQIQLSGSLANGMYILNLRSAGQDNIFHFVVEQ